jgi:hypothetical protein
MAMDDRIRVSDADRDNVAASLRDHFAAGRLTLSELHERISAALSAVTVGDLRRLLADLPEPAPVARQAGRPQAVRPQEWRPQAGRSQAGRSRWDGPAWPVRRRYGPRPPVLLLALLGVLLIPGSGWLLLALVNVLVLVLLVTGLATAFAVGRPHGRSHRRVYWL